MPVATFTCTLGTCPISLAYVHYRPTIPGNAFMIGAFSLLTPLALFLGIRYKTALYTSVFVAGLVGEVVGYAGRILLHQNPFSKPAFLTYLICLTLAPVFMTAAIYLTLARVVVLYGERLSFVKPRSYTYIFTGFDVVALAVQAAGGAIAALAEETPDVWHFLTIFPRLGFACSPVASFRSKKERTSSLRAYQCKSRASWPSSSSLPILHGK